jgi:putative oxidoreductase
MFRKLLFTENEYSLTAARLTLGVVMFAHGAQKALGWFGGAGFDRTVGFLTTGIHIPAFLAVIAILAEFLGGLGLIVGLLSRVAAFGIAVNMIVAIATVHAPNGFFMNWMGNQKGEGFEYHLLAIGLATATMIGGAGALSLDRILSRPHTAPAGFPAPHAVAH